MLGNGRLSAICFDGVIRLCHIRGKLRKKVWVNQGDIVLIGLRDYQDAKADVILKYVAVTPDHLGHTVFACGFRLGFPLTRFGRTAALVVP